MLKHTLKFALRSFRKSKLIHGLNILGLTLGLSVFFLTSLYIYQEKSYERDFSEIDKVYQISSVIPGIGDFALTTPNLASIVNDIPEVEALTVFSTPFTSSWNDDDEESFALLTFYVDDKFLSVFDFKVLAGDPERPISEPSHAAIFESAALKIFGTTDVIGKRLTQQNKSIQIVALLADPQYKTQLKSDLITFSDPLKDYKTGNWNSNVHFVYAKTKDNISKAQLNQTLKRLSYDYIRPVNLAASPSDTTPDVWEKSPKYKGFKAESIDDLRLSSESMMSIMPKANSNQLNAMILVGLASLLISVINFINLFTAKASARHKEVGVKRMLGSRKWYLIFQFLTESFMLTSLSAIMALAVVESLQIVGASFLAGIVDYSVLQSVEWVLGVVLFVITLSLIGGIYPALYLSSGSLINLAKKGTTSNQFSIANARGFRKVATVLQFVCSIGLIFAIVVIFTQIDFLKNRDLGYSDEGVVVIQNLGVFQNLRDNTSSLKTFINEIERIPSVQSFGFSSRTPIDKVQYFPIPMKNEDGVEVKVTFMNADSGFFDLMKMKVVDGELFGSRPIASSSDSLKRAYLPVVINEMTAKVLGFENPVGQIIDQGISGNTYEVVGMVKDFFFGSLKQAVEPIIIRQSTASASGVLLIKTDEANETIAAIEPIFQRHVWAGWGAQTMLWNDMETRYDSLLEAETSGYKLLVVFSGIAVIISCIGLLGLSLFTIDQRLHEFGIRKVLGATVMNIMALFSFDVFKLILLALLIALPIGSYIMREWLNDFVAQVNLSAFIFLITILLTGVIVFFTIFFQSLKAGRLNPVDTLRNE